MSDNAAAAQAEATATAATQNTEATASQITGVDSSWWRDGFFDDLADLSRAIATGAPVDIGRALKALAALASGAVIATMAVGLLGIHGGIIGALAAAAGMVAVDVLLQKVGGSY